MTVKAKQKLTHTFNVDYVSLIDDVRYQGAFTTKKLAIADISSLGVRKAQLNGGLHYDERTPGRGVDQETDEFNAMLAQLDVCLVKWPEWWNLSQISDPGLLYKVFEEVANFEATFLSRTRAGADNGSVGNEQADSTGAVQAPVADRHAGEVVDPEVSAALEP